MWKKLKLSSDSGDSGSNNADEAMVGSGGVCVVGVRCLVVSFVLVCLAGIWLQLP
jgi:hypothetical protein